MSHVNLKEAARADQQIPMTEMGVMALEHAAVRCGAVFKRGQSTFQTYASQAGSVVGDWSSPEGYTVAELVAGRCKHAIGLPPHRAAKGGTLAYEVGVVESKAHPGTLSLMYDFFGGHLDELLTTPEALKRRRSSDQDDPGLDKLMEYYQLEVHKLQAAQLGDVVESEQVLADGTVELVIDTTLRLGV